MLDASHFFFCVCSPPMVYYANLVDSLFWAICSNLLCAPAAPQPSTSGKSNRNIWWNLVSRNASNESCWMAASGLPQFFFVFFGSKNQEDAHIYRYNSIGVQSDTFVSRWYANTPRSFCGNPEAAIQYSSLPGVPLAEIHHFFPLLFPKCSAAGLRVRTANLSRWP